MTGHRARALPPAGEAIRELPPSADRQSRCLAPADNGARASVARRALRGPSQAERGADAGSAVPCSRAALTQRTAQFGKAPR